MYFQDLTVLADEFQLSLFLASTTRPLLLILDSLDQLDPSHNARQLQWLPAKLRPNVKIIVSTLPDAQFECLPVLQVIGNVVAKISGLFPAIWEKAPGQNWKKMINLTSKEREINDIEYKRVAKYIIKIK